MPSISGGQVQPFGVRKTIIGQAGRFTTPLWRASSQICTNLRHDRVEHSGELLMDRRRVVSFDEVRLVAHALEELPQLVVRDAGEEAGVGDLVAVQMEDRQHAAVAGRVEELVPVPAGGERAGLRLAVADDAGDDQVRVVERRAVGVAQGVPELATLVDAARRLRRDVAGDASREAELLEQLFIPSAS